LRRKLQTHNSGFTLVEMAVVLGLIGVLVAAGVKFGLSLSERLQYAETEAKMEKIIDAIAVFTARNYRVPCPSAPGPDPLNDPETLAAAETQLRAPTSSFHDRNTKWGDEKNSHGSWQNLIGSNNRLHASAGFCSDTVLTSADAANPGADDPQGIIPFYALGLTAEDAKDAWGNYFTYHVSPAMAVNIMDDAIPRDFLSLPNRMFPEIYPPFFPKQATGYPDVVHADCRTPVWIDPVSGDNIHAPKARFCCPLIGKTLPWLGLGYYTPSPADIPDIWDPRESDIIILDENDDQIAPMPGQERSSDPDHYDHFDVVVPALPDRPVGSDFTPGENRDNSAEGIAFVLISHGPNGHGAFLRDATRVDKAHGTLEEDNAYDLFDDTVTRDTKRTFRAAPRNDDESGGGVNYFDDLVKWRTNHQLVAHFGRDSCARP